MSMFLSTLISMVVIRDHIWSFGPQCICVLCLAGAVVLNYFIIMNCAAFLVGLSTILALEFFFVRLDFRCQALFLNNFFQIHVRLVLNAVFLCCSNQPVS